MKLNKTIAKQDRVKQDHVNQDRDKQDRVNQAGLLLRKNSRVGDLYGGRKPWSFYMQARSQEFFVGGAAVGPL